MSVAPAKMDLNMLVTAVTTTGSHIKFYAQLNSEKFASLDSLIVSLQPHFEQSVLSSAYGLTPGSLVMVRSTVGSAARWHRARVTMPQSAEYASVEYIDYGTTEVAHCSQICGGSLPAAAAVLAQPPVCAPCVLAEVAPIVGAWSDTAVSIVESQIRFRMVQGELLRQDADGLLHVRVLLPEGGSLAARLVAAGMARHLTEPSQLPTSHPPLMQTPPPNMQQQQQPHMLPEQYEQIAAVVHRASVPPPTSLSSPPPTAFVKGVKELKSTAHSPGDELSVTICSYSNGAAKFAIRDHSSRSTFNELVAAIQAYCCGHPAVPLPSLETGAVCLSLAATHGGKYQRGIVTQVGGDNVKVYWADFGDDETKSRSEVRAMPVQFAQASIQAQRVSLAGLEALTAVPGQQSTFRRITEDRILNCRFAKSRAEKVELFDMGVSVLELLLRWGAYTRGGASPRPSSAAPPSRPVSAALSTSPPPSLLQPGTHEDVVVVAVTALNNLSVRPADAEPQLQQLQTQLTDTLNVHAVPLSADQLTEGLACAVFKDAGYHRARVVTVGRRDVKVVFLDLGTSEMISAAAAFLLEPRLAALPPQAVTCCLYGLEASYGTADLVSYLSSLTADRTLLCEVLDKIGEKRIVRLTDRRRQPPLEINAAIKDRMKGGKVTLPPAAPPPTPTSAGSCAGSEKSSGGGGDKTFIQLPKVELGRREAVAVMFVESPSHWFCQLLSTDADAMYAMEEAMQALYGGGGARPLTVARPGLLCAAASSLNGTFYRARVLKTDGLRATVQYIDYGDSEEKLLSEVFPLRPEFTTLPQLGIFCQLLGAESVPASGFCDLMGEQTVEVLPRSGAGDRFQVLLPAGPTNDRLLTELRALGYSELPPSGSPAPAAGPAAPAARSAASPKASTPSEPAVAEVSPLKLPVGVFKDVEAVHVVAPSEFYVTPKESSAALASLEQQLAAVYATVAPPAAVEVGRPVAVLCGVQTQVWSRGRVIARKDKEVTVFLLDAGATVTVPVSAVRPLRPEHARLPAQAVRCTAAGAAAHYTDDEVARFRLGALGRRFVARVEEVRAGSCVVTLAQAQPVSVPGDAADANNNDRKQPRATPPRSDQNMNWREKSSAAVPAVPAANGADSANWRAGAESRPHGDGMRARERRSSAARSEPRPPPPRSEKPPPPSAPEPVKKPPPAPEPVKKPPPAPAPEPAIDRFAGKMRMDDPAEYLSVSRARDAGGDSWQQNGVTNETKAEKPKPVGGWGDPGSAGEKAEKQAPVTVPAHDATIAKRCLQEGESVTGTPTWVAGLHRFHVQPAKDNGDFAKLMTELQSFYGGLKPGEAAETDLKPGRPVVAKFSDSAWYRAEVRSCEGGKVRLLFLDYGNADWVSRGDVRRIKEQFCWLPWQAYCCRFGGVQPAGGMWKEPSMAQLAKYFSEEITITCLTSSGVWNEVEVTNKDAKVTDLLVADGFAERPEPPQKLHPQHLGPFSPLGAEYRRGQRVALFVSYIAAPDRLYGQHSDAASAVEKLEADIEDATAAGLPLPSPAAGQACLAPFDGVFYRGAVVSTKGATAAVHFVDYGNTETLKVDELLQCPAALLRVPAQAVPLALSGVRSDKMDDLVSRADQMDLVATVDRVMSDRLEVTLWDGKTNVNLELGGTEPPPPTHTRPAPSAKPASTNVTASAKPASTNVTASTKPASTTVTASAKPASTNVTASIKPASTNVTKPVSATVAKAAAQTVATPAAKVPAEAVVHSPSRAAPAAATRRGVVAFTVSPAEFYLQDAGRAHLLDELMEQLDAEYTGLAEGERALYEVKPGDLVAAPFSEDGAFYRARVLSQSGDTLQLHFIDYGNGESAARADCRQLSPTLRSPSPFAHLCRLPVAPPKDEWTSAATERFDQLVGAPDAEVALTVVLEGDEESGWTVEVTGISGDDVVTALLAAGLAKRTEVAAAPSAAEKTADPTEAEAGSGGGAAEEGERGVLSRLRPGEPAAAAVVHADSPADFWVQLLVDSDALDQLMTELEAAEPTAAAGAAAAAGLLVAVRYSEDGGLYRARVLHTDADGSADVRFIDYGNTERVPADGLLACPASVAAAAPLAARCRLSLQQAGPWPAAATQRFSELAGVGDDAAELQLTLFEAGNEEEPATVALVRDGTDLATALVEEGFSTLMETTNTDGAEKKGTAADDTEPAETAATSADTAAVSGNLSKQEPELPALSRLRPGEPAAAAVVHADSPADFWVQLLADSDTLDQLMTDLETAEPTAAAGAATAGLLVAVRYSEDGGLYRARVLHTDADGSADVRFIDYGNTERVSADGLLACPASVAAAAPLAARCRLSLQQAGPWPAAATQRFSELAGVGDDAAELQLTLLEAGDPVTVSLIRDGADLATTLVDEGFCTATKTDATEEIPETEEASARETETAEVYEDTAEVEKPATALGGPGEQEVFVTHVNSPTDFFIQLADTTVLDALMETLAAGESAAATNPQLGDLVAAKFSQDGEVYRASVLGLEDDQTSVLFIDYGNVEKVAAAELRQLPAELQEAPPQALRCRLAVEECADAAGARLEELTAEGATVSVLSRDGDHALVRLSVAGTDVASCLVAAGLCRHQRRQDLPPQLPLSLASDLPVTVTYVESPTEVYLLPRDDTVALAELQQQLDALYESDGGAAALQAPTEGQLCVTRRPGHPGWHRASVLAVDAETGAVRVRLVDSGAPVQTVVSRLLQPLSAVTLAPALAHRCLLSSTGSDTDAHDQLTAVSRLREVCRSDGGAITARLGAAGGELRAELAVGGRPLAELLRDRDAAAPSPRPGARLRTEEKIVPGQIAFQLILEAEESGKVAQTAESIEQSSELTPATDRETEEADREAGDNDEPSGESVDTANSIVKLPTAEDIEEPCEDTDRGDAVIAEACKSAADVSSTAEEAGTTASDSQEFCQPEALSTYSIKPAISADNRMDHEELAGEEVDMGAGYAEEGDETDGSGRHAEAGEDQGIQIETYETRVEVREEHMGEAVCDVKGMPSSEEKQSAGEDSALMQEPTSAVEEAVTAEDPTSDEGYGVTAEDGRTTPVEVDDPDVEEAETRTPIEEEEEVASVEEAVVCKQVIDEISGASEKVEGESKGESTGNKQRLPESTEIKPASAEEVPVVDTVREPPLDTEKTAHECEAQESEVAEPDIGDVIKQALMQCLACDLAKTEAFAEALEALATEEVQVCRVHSVEDSTDVEAANEEAIGDGDVTASKGTSPGTEEEFRVIQTKLDTIEEESVALDESVVVKQAPLMVPEPMTIYASILTEDSDALEDAREDSGPRDISTPYHDIRSRLPAEDSTRVGAEAAVPTAKESAKEEDETVCSCSALDTAVLVDNFGPDSSLFSVTATEETDVANIPATGDQIATDTANGGLEANREVITYDDPTSEDSQLHACDTDEIAREAPVGLEQNSTISDVVSAAIVEIASRIDVETPSIVVEKGPAEDAEATAVGSEVTPISDVREIIVTDVEEAPASDVEVIITDVEEGSAVEEVVAIGVEAPASDVEEVIITDVEEASGSAVEEVIIIDEEEASGSAVEEVVAIGVEAPASDVEEVIIIGVEEAPVSDVEVIVTGVEEAAAFDVEVTATGVEEDPASDVEVIPTGVEEASPFDVEKAIVTVVEEVIVTVVQEAPASDMEEVIVGGDGTPASDVEEVPVAVNEASASVEETSPTSVEETYTCCMDETAASDRKLVPASGVEDSTSDAGEVPSYEEAPASALDIKVLSTFSVDVLPATDLQEAPSLNTTEAPAPDVEEALVQDAQVYTPEKEKHPTADVTETPAADLEEPTAAGAAEARAPFREEEAGVASATDSTVLLFPTVTDEELRAMEEEISQLCLDDWTTNLESNRTSSVQDVGGGFSPTAGDASSSVQAAAAADEKLAKSDEQRTGGSA